MERWRGPVVGRAAAAAGPAAPLLDLVGACRTGLPDILLPHVPGTRRRLADELDALVATTPDEVRQALAGYGDRPGVPRAVIELRDGDTRRLRLLADGALALFRASLAEDWPDIQRHLRTDIAHRAHLAGESGIGAVLGGLHHRASWLQDGVLRCALDGPDRTVDLDGRGLELHPNFFVQGGVGAVLVPCRPAVLLHPTASPTAGPSAGREPATADPLTDLIGAARARALRAVGQAPCSTTELVARLGTSLSTASTHAAVLRTTGAITTQRQGRQVRHLVAPLGHALLAAST